MTADQESRGSCELFCCTKFLFVYFAVSRATRSESQPRVAVRWYCNARLQRERAEIMVLLAMPIKAISHMICAIMACAPQNARRH